MTKYIHNLAHIGVVDGSELVKQLDELSDMGWEVVSAVPVVGYLQTSQTEGAPTNWYARTILLILRMPEDEFHK